MNDPRKSVFDAAKSISRPGIFNDPGNILALNNILDAFGAPREFPAVAPDALPATTITPKIMAEIVSHEAIVLEWYKDSKGIGTWGIGVTNASGHSVDRYKDNPQTIERVLEVYAWLLKEKYLPDVLKAFKRRALTEAQLAAALSFHYNTGAILRADWVESWLGGNVRGAAKEFMNWKVPASIIPRREAERDLFFDGTWSGNGVTTIWPVNKPSYSPAWSKGKQVNILPYLEKLVC
jgi:GH24 family phage-related lysozyme (muramidase)